MTTPMYWIPGPWPGRMAIMPRPRGGDWLEEEIQGWRRSGVDVIVSLLTPDEVEELDLSDEEVLCRASGIQFLSLPVADRGIPAAREAVSELVSRLHDYLVEGRNIAIHCRQGIGRAALIAIGVLLDSGFDVDSAIQRVSGARGCPVPETVEQLRWIAAYGHLLPSR